MLETYEGPRLTVATAVALADIITHSKAACQQYCFVEKRHGQATCQHATQSTAKRHVCRQHLVQEGLSRILHFLVERDFISNDMPSPILTLSPNNMTLLLEEGIPYLTPRKSSACNDSNNNNSGLSDRKRAPIHRCATLKCRIHCKTQYFCKHAPMSRPKNARPKNEKKLRVPLQKYCVLQGILIASI